ncbi:metallophosphoesterase family protein [Daejeonella sp. JGW-45]|uniref:metallophosphoesterase family protein n=1 Tax=Daejeonella sp. JGW-45 TaxID=3034148 RepID=UPI0023ED52CB|nr:metallophosphoesterase family protein [Daejeonella sp. JGW-45]
MRIALFSDIHANLPAFEAFLADLDRRKPDVVYCLGDLVGYNVWPNEVIAEVQRRGIATLAGNHDLKVKNLAPIDIDQLNLSGKNYAYHLITEKNREYLTALPTHIKLEYQLGDEKLGILFTHGSPRSVDEYVLEDTNEDYVLELMAEAGADILCVGHSHKPYHRIIERQGAIKQVVNIGSVGKPKDGNPLGCYVLITINKNSFTKITSGIQVAFIRFEYDIEKAANAIENSPLPVELADRLRKAY